MEVVDERPQTVIPGMKLGEVGTFEPGPGTYVIKKNIFSSLVGEVRTEQHDGERRVVSVVWSTGPSVVPTVGSIVIGSYLFGVVVTFYSALITF